MSEQDVSGWDIVKSEKELQQAKEAAKPVKTKSPQQLEIESNRKKCKFIYFHKGQYRIDEEAMYNWFRRYGNKFYKDNFCIIGHVLYAWNGRFWQQDQEKEYIKKYTFKKLDEKFDITLNSRNMDEIISINRCKDYILEEESWGWGHQFDKQISITFGNGTLKIDFTNNTHTFYKGEYFKDDGAVFILYDHFEEKLLEPDYWKQGFVGKYLLEYYEDEAREQLQKFLAAILIPQYELQQALVILGEGGDGKGVLMGALKRLLWTAVSELRVSEWDGKHDLVALIGSILNITSERPSREISVDVFKSIVACDYTRMNPKFEKTFGYKPFCKHIMTVNSLPKMEIDKAVLRRLPIIRTCKTTTFEERDVFFRRDFEADNAGLMSFMLQGLFLLKRDNFKGIKGTRDLMEEFIHENEPLIMDFVTECLEITGKKSDAAISKELHEVFLLWKLENGKIYKDLTRSTLSKKIITVAKALSKQVVYSDSRRVSRTVKDNEHPGNTCRVLVGLLINEEWLEKYKEDKKTKDYFKIY